MTPIVRICWPPLLQYQFAGARVTRPISSAGKRTQPKMKKCIPTRNWLHTLHGLRAKGDITRLGIIGARPSRPSLGCRNDGRAASSPVAMRDPEKIRLGRVEARGGAGYRTSLARTASVGKRSRRRQLDGRTAEATAGFSGADRYFADSGAGWLRAMAALDAALLLPEQPDARSRRAKNARAHVRTGWRARSHLALLEAALGQPTSRARDAKAPADVTAEALSSAGA